jgi:hypothetical protein
MPQKESGLSARKAGLSAYWLVGLSRPLNLLRLLRAQPLGKVEFTLPPADRTRLNQ